MEYTPKGKTKSSDLAMIGLFALCVVSFVTANLPIRYVWVMRAVGIVSLTAAVYLAVRYRLSQLVYAVGGEVGDEIFTVYLDRGRNKTAICRLAMCDLLSVRRFADPEAAKEAEKGFETHSYVQSMTPDSLVLCEFASSGERDLCVVLECDEAFERTLAAFAERNLRDATTV